MQLHLDKQAFFEQQNGQGDRSYTNKKVETSADLNKFEYPWVFLDLMYYICNAQITFHQAPEEESEKSESSYSYETSEEEEEATESPQPLDLYQKKLLAEKKK